MAIGTRVSRQRWSRMRAYAVGGERFERFKAAAENAGYLIDEALVLASVCRFSQLVLSRRDIAKGSSYLALAGLLFFGSALMWSGGGS